MIRSSSRMYPNESEGRASCGDLHDHNRTTDSWHRATASQGGLETSSGKPGRAARQPGPRESVRVTSGTVMSERHEDPDGMEDDQWTRISGQTVSPERSHFHTRPTEAPRREG